MKGHNLSFQADTGAGMAMAGARDPGCIDAERERLVMNTMRLRWRMTAGLCGLLLGGMVVGAQAGVCSYARGTNSQATYSFSVPATIALTGTESVGTVLWTSSSVIGDKAVFTDCPGGAGAAGLTDYWGTTSTVAGATNVMPTNVAGIGYAIRWSGGFVSGVKGYPSNPDGTAPTNIGTAGDTSTAMLIFVKTAAAYFSGTSAATNRSGDFSTWYVGTNRLRFVNFTVSNTTTFTKPDGGGGCGGGGAATCRIENVFVNLGANPGTAFAAIGSKGKVVPVKFMISCSGTVTSLNLAFSSTTGTVAGMDGVATLSNESGVAGGIGVVLLRVDQTTAVQFGQQYRVGIRNDSSGSYAQPIYYAAPIKIADTIRSGTVKSAMIATLTYN